MTTTQKPMINEDVDLLVAAASEAGEIALGYFKSKNEVWMKGGNSPVSEADHAVNDHLNKVLRGARPHYAWVSEETVDVGDRLDQDHVFIVDPIDGTRGFLNGSPEWCISAAVTDQGDPVAAILFCPALDQMWSAGKNMGAFLNGRPITCPQIDQITHVTGSRKLNQLMDEADIGLRVSAFVPSLALRLARVANGELDAAFARPGAHEWDIAAADLILREAGGSLVDMQAQTPVYNKESLRSSALIACAKGTENTVISLAKSHGFLQ